MPQMGGGGGGHGGGSVGGRGGGERGHGAGRGPDRDRDRDRDREVRFVTGSFGCPPGFTWSSTKGRCIRVKRKKRT